MKTTTQDIPLKTEPPSTKSRRVQSFRSPYWPWKHETIIELPVDPKYGVQEAVDDVAPEKIGIVHEGRTYEVVDRPEQFGPEDWDRVICVVCSGHEWQFRNWKWESPDELFQHVRGIYFKWSHETLKDEIKAWRIVTVDVSIFGKVVV